MKHNPSVDKKQCTVCKEVKLLKDFHSVRAGTVYRTQCKICWNNLIKERYKAKKDGTFVSKYNLSKVPSVKKQNFSDFDILRYKNNKVYDYLKTLFMHGCKFNGHTFFEDKHKKIDLIRVLTRPVWENLYERLKEYSEGVDYYGNTF